MKSLQRKEECHSDVAKFRYVYHYCLCPLSYKATMAKQKELIRIIRKVAELQICNYINLDCVVFSDSINPLTMRIFAKILPLLVGVFLIALLSLNFVFKVHKGLTEIAIFSDSQRFVLRPPAVEASTENDGELKSLVKK